MTSEEKLENNISQYGWTVINVLGDEDEKSYSYSVGFHKSFNHPEIVISGLDGEVASQIINSIGDAIKNGEVYKPSIKYSGILSNFPCEFHAVNSQVYDYLFGKAQWLYKSEFYEVYQMLYPDKTGKFPWDEGYSMTIQDLLCKY
jgi:hypothetical protein